MTTLWDYRRALLAVGAGLLLVVTPITAEAAAPGIFLTPEHLVEAGLHLPSYMPTIDRMMEFQTKLTYHQELTVEWDSIPGQTATVPASTVAGSTPAPNFILLDRKQQARGPAGKSHWDVGADLVIAAVTSQNQVRGLKIQGDPRFSYTEDLRPGHKHQRWDYVTPKVTIHILFPDDPQIQTVIFFIPAKGTGAGVWRLQEVGRLALPPR